MGDTHRLNFTVLHRTFGIHYIPYHIMSQEEVNEQLEALIEARIKQMNEQAMQAFEGYTPLDMDALLYRLFQPDCPVQLGPLTEEEVAQVPMFQLVKHLMKAIETSGELKLTATGALPVKLVKDLYEKGFIEEELIAKGIGKLAREQDAMSIHLARILVEMSGLAKKRIGKLSLTKQGQKALSDHNLLLKTILVTFCTKFNWAYFDGFGDNNIGQLGCGFTMVLLSKYGTEKRPASFYGSKYFLAFPRLAEGLQESPYDSVEERLQRCYEVRTFPRFLHYFGIIEIVEVKKEGKYFPELHITKTGLFDRLIRCSPRA